MPARITAFHSTHLPFEADSTKRSLGGSGQKDEALTFSTIDPRDRNCRNGVSSTPVIGVDPAADNSDLFFGGHVGMHGGKAYTQFFLFKGGRPSF